MRGIDMSVLAACGYALFLAGVAATLELLARHSHNRSKRMRTAGFAYHADLDVWKCPNGKHLYRAEAALDSALVVYRAAPHDCKHCPIKSRCTDSDEGRTIQVQPDSWLQSELRNFHRGLSLVLLLLADLILAVTVVAKNKFNDDLAAGFLLLCITWTGIRLARDFFRATTRDLSR
jgi:hypothetical protein